MVVGKTKEAASAFAQALTSRSPLLSASDVLGAASFAHKDTLRQARVRCDVASMRLNRSLWTQMVKQPTLVDIYLFADASPQWRGAELFAGQMEILMGTYFKKSFLPRVTISRSMLSAVGKAFGLIWQVFL